mmetsp:Transcript_12817/g.14708  ORF Transcript_12817/g.14708 Transcript_12817/m.14708 type:complete len:231 (+) Transcript_12817:114-806(+)
MRKSMKVLLGKGDSKAKAMKDEEEHYDLEAQLIFQRLNGELERNENGERNVYGNFRALDPIYEDPLTGAKIYVGNKSAAENLSLLNKMNIHRIVNCTSNQKLKFEKNKDFKYYRFTIALWEQLEIKSDEETLDFVRPMLDFVDKSLAEGESVLVHCLAGAHRAGTTGVLLLMAKMKYNSTRATELAIKLRPLINPFGTLLKFLYRVDKAVDRLNSTGKLSKGDAWFRSKA